MKGYMVLLLLCLASLQLIDAGRGSARSGGGYSSSSSSRYSSSSYRSAYSSRSGGGYSRSSGGSYVSRSGGGYSSRSSSGGGGYSGGRSGGGSSVSRGGGRNSGSSGVSRSRNTGYSQSSNHGYGSVYSGYGSGTYKNGGKSFKDKGYGTRWGTIFKKQGKHTGYSKKAFGLGVAAGFVGEAVVGLDATAATYGVYHRYNKYRDLMYRRRYGTYGPDFHDDWGWGQYGWSPGYYNDYYRNNRCRYSCPYDNDYYSVCRYGFCDCDIGLGRRYGRCRRIGYDWSQYTKRRNFDWSCVNNEQCFDYDFNLICDKSLVTAGSAGRCKCRTDMKWNAESSECQLYLDVDCTKFTYETKVSPQVEQAVEKAEHRLANEPQNDESNNILVAGNETDDYDYDLLFFHMEVLNETISIDNVLKTSLLTDIDPNDRSLTDDDITEAYCRDVDAFSHEFQKGGSIGYNPRKTGRGNLAKKIALGADILSFFLPLLVA